MEFNADKEIREQPKSQQFDDQDKILIGDRDKFVTFSLNSNSNLSSPESPNIQNLGQNFEKMFLLYL